MDSNNVAGMPNPQNQPVNPPVEPNPVEQALAEEPAPAPVPMSAPVKKSGKGAIYGMIFFVILAIAGIGFGVYMMMDGNTQKEALNNQITDLKAQNSKLLEQLAEGGSEGGGEITPTPSVNTKDYIYIGEWGLKIKIADGLNYVSYDYHHSGGPNQTEGTTISISATTSNELKDFANPYMNTSSLGAISRIKKGTYEAMGYTSNEGCGVSSTLIFSDDEYNYCYSHPQDVYSQNEEDQKLEIASVNLIQTMLSTASNYSKF